MFFIEISILILYLRVFAPSRWARYWIYAGIGYIFSTSAILTTLFIAFCAPRTGESVRDQVTAPLCKHSSENLTLAAAAVNFIGDVYLMGLPLPMILKLQLSRNRRVSLIVVFMTGILYDTKLITPADAYRLTMPALQV